MSEAKDYGEPWKLGLLCVNDRNGDLAFRTEAVGIKDVHRIVACVNACRGIVDPASALAAAREALELSWKLMPRIHPTRKSMDAAHNDCCQKIAAALTLLAPERKDTT